MKLNWQLFFSVANYCVGNRLVGEVSPANLVPRVIVDAAYVYWLMAAAQQGNPTQDIAVCIDASTTTAHHHPLCSELFD